MSNELIHNPRQFDEVIHIIDNACSCALKAINAELIQMYWKIGAYVSGRVKNGGRGKVWSPIFPNFCKHIIWEQRDFLRRISGVRGSFMRLIVTTKISHHW